MVFKHFGNECAHNELAWTPCFLSRLSSWASPSGLAKVQKQTLNSYVSVSLLTFTAITSDSLSCLHFLKISSSREMTTHVYPVPTLKKEVPYQRFSPKTSPDFYDRISPRESSVSGRISSISAVTKDGLLPKAHENIMERKLMKPLSSVSKEKKKKIFAPDSSQGRCTMVLSYFLRREQARGKRNRRPHYLNQHSLECFNLWTSEGILMASYFLPHPQQAIFRFSYIIKVPVEVKRRLSS